MKIKIISSILTFILLIQITIIIGGCMTFSPTYDNNLAHYRKDENTLLIKLKDKRILKVEPESLVYYGNDSLIIYGEGNEFDLSDSTYSGLKKFKGFISPAKIDSEQLIMYDDTKYHIFWMNNNRRLSIMHKNLGRFYSDSMDYYWVAKADSVGYQQIYSDDIAGLERKDKLTVGGYVYYGLLFGVMALSYAVFSHWH
jgi:hypothetical protein